MIVAPYVIPAMAEKGAEIKGNLRKRLMSIIGDTGATVADEAEQHRDFLDFGRSNISLLLLLNKQTSAYSVYLEFRVPETGKLIGGTLLPFAAFNKRFGQFFENKQE